MKNIFLTVLFCIFALFVNSQTYNMDNTPVTTCTGDFYDDGGNPGNYGKNKNFTKTFTPNAAGNNLRFVFGTWTIGDDQDILSIYDGPNTGSPLIGTFNLASGSPGTITATNGTGQLTFNWVTDGNGQAEGWTATISCIPPPPPAPVNDNCSGAILLNVNASCVYQTFTNVNATASSGVPAPGCANYVDDDVWFKFVAPVSGCVNINSNSGGITDGGMALYSGPCNNLVLVECDDDDSPNGLMPMIDRTGLTPGATYYIRFWEYGGDIQGTFDICISSPCTGVPAGGTATANPTSINCTGQSLTLTCTGMATSCVTYQWQSSPDNAIWTDIPTATSTIYTYAPVTSLYYRLKTTCAGGGSSGYSNVVLVPVSTTIAPTCNLNYSVSTIAYNASNMGGSVEVSIPADDRYSSNWIPIGFNFCYDGIQYTQLLISSNSYLIFDAIGCATNEPTGNATPGGWTDWEITMATPNTTEAPRNCIMFPWQDSDPNNGGALSYKVFGASPNRIFVVEFDNVAMYGSSCTTYNFTAQVKLFETTNNIEMHLKQKDMCAAWNAGAAILGLHNYNGTIAVVPAGYNYPTQWTATNEAWRFTCNCPTCVNPLPITLLDFKAECFGADRKISWKTASEQNADYFIVKKSTDGVNFTVASTIKATGNSNEIIEYSIIDKTPSVLVYYQLEEYDYNGAKTVFNMISSNCVNKDKFSIRPNPSNTTDGIEIIGDVYSIEVMDIFGKKIDINMVNNHIIGLPSGIYIIIINGYYRTKIIIN